MAANDDMRVRGAVINGFLKYIHKTWGAKGESDVRTAAHITDVTIKEGQYYNILILDRIMQWIAMNHGIDKVKLGGKFTVMNLGALSYLVRFLNMETMLKRTYKGVKEAYTFGNPVLEIKGNTAYIEMRGYIRMKESCVAWEGAFEGLLELTKTKGRVEQVECIFEGGEHCKYTITWE